MPTSDTFLPEIIQSTFFSGYTIFNTVVYSLILVLFIIAIIRMFKKIEIDPKSIIFSLIPFIIWGSSTRALVDNGIYPKTVFLITPGLYILVGLTTIASLLFCIYLYNRKNVDYRYSLFLIGVILTIPNLILIPHLNIQAMFYVIAAWLIFTCIFIAVGFAWDLFKDKINLAIISAHMFDASSTFIAVDFFNYSEHDASSTFIAVDFFNYSEQHVLSNAIYSLTDTALSMYILKIIVIVAVIYIIDQYIEDETAKGLLKLAVFVLGLAPGMRNFLTLAIAT